MTSLPISVRCALALFATLGSLVSFSSLSAVEAKADRIAKRREQRPAGLDLSRRRPLVGWPGLEASVFFPRGEPRQEKIFDIILCFEARTPEGFATAQEALRTHSLQAIMPEHAHGMMVAPTRVPAQGAGVSESNASSATRPQACATWRGLRFHMAGWWRLDVRSGSGKAWRCTCALSSRRVRCTSRARRAFSVRQ
jgi:hypothetical protein